MNWKWSRFIRMSVESEKSAKCVKNLNRHEIVSKRVFYRTAVNGTSTVSFIWLFIVLRFVLRNWPALNLGQGTLPSHIYLILLILLDHTWLQNNRKSVIQLFCLGVSLIVPLTTQVHRKFLLSQENLLPSTGCP